MPNDHEVFSFDSIHYSEKKSWQQLSIFFHSIQFNEQKAWRVAMR
jgi:hypothetical protein